MKMNVGDFEHLTFSAQTCAEGERVQKPQDGARSFTVALWRVILA